MRSIALVALICALMPWASAQRSSSPGVSHHPAGAFPRWTAYPIPVFFDASYPGVGFNPPQAAPPTVIVVQAPAPAETMPAATPAQPLVIELRGNRYVRLSDGEDSDAQSVEPIATTEPAALQKATDKIPSTRSRDQQPAVLVFRDGHREEVSAYTIAGGAIYVSGDFYANGSWTRRIDLASLDLPETAAGNRNRYIQFRLPASPNEVIVGP